MEWLYNFQWHFKGQDHAPMFIMARSKEEAIALIIKMYKVKKTEIIIDHIVD